MLEETVFPKHIEEFGYKFNENGELRNIKTNEKFLFFVRPDDRSYNQRHYEALGEAIGEFIEDELVDKYNLVRKIIPVGSEEDDNIAKSRIYLSDDAQECQTLLLLIQGSGVVRPGQWARQVIINETLELGTMFPYIRKAQELKWGIIIFNPNENYGSIMKDGEVIYDRVPGSETSKDHCLYVWEKFVKNSKAEKILIVAHSYGGICTTYLIDDFADEFKLRVKGIALTDSVHSSGMVPSHSRKWFYKNTSNWIKSSLPIDDYVDEATQYYGCRCFSAGHPKHEYTSGYAFDTVFRYLQGRLKEKYNKEKTNQEDKTDEQSLVANNGSSDELPKEMLNTQDTTSSMEVDVLNTQGTTSTDESMDESSKAVINMQTQEASPVPLEKDITSTEKVNETSKATINIQTQETSPVTPVPLEKDITEEMIESPKAAINMQTQENDSISTEKVTTATKDMKESQLDSPMEIDEPQITVEIDNADNAETASGNLNKAFPSDKTPELVTNDNEESKEKAIIENNTCKNQVVTTENVSNEIIPDSTSIQQAKNDGISKESSQDCNSIQEQTENSTTPDQKNNQKLFKI